MVATTTSPNVDNYYVGKGIVYIKLTGDADWVDVGNVPEFEFTPNIERLDHFSSRAGTRSKDRSIVLEKGGTLRIVLEEWTARNLSMALMGPVDDTDPERPTIDIFASNVIPASVKFEGTNEVGPKWTLTFPKVEFAPSAALNPISDEWGQIEVEGEVLFDDGTGTFGTAVGDFNAES